MSGGHVFLRIRFRFDRRCSVHLRYGLERDASSFWLILRRWKLVRIRSACAGRTKEDLAAIGEGDITCVGALFGMVTRLVAVNDDFESRRKSSLVDPAPKQCVGASALKHPDFRCAVRLGHFDMDPGMGIDPFYFYDLAPDQNRGIGIEFGSKRVMRCCRLRSDQQQNSTT